MKYLLLVSTIFLLFSCSDNVVKPSEIFYDYQIGDIGPGGGFIFYDHGDDILGWRFLEVSPVLHEVPMPWGALGIDIADTQTEIGSGKHNTQLILNALQAQNETEVAALYCYHFVLNGKRDWFLPSKDELHLLYVAHSKFGDFDEFWYWSSSQSYADKYRAWGQRFNDGEQEDFLKSNIRMVRPIRSF
jgi:hypothetical protein